MWLQKYILHNTFFVDNQRNREKLNSNAVTFEIMSKIVLLLYAIAKGDILISTNSCLSANGQQ
jgi:hypothetical protein